jgi:hypothetical protein
MPNILEEYQEKALVSADKCPVCKRPNIIHRKLRNDYICGWCKNFFKTNNGRMEHLGKRIFRDRKWQDSYLGN